MKVPHRIIGRTRPQAAQMAYLSPVDTTGGGRALASGLNMLADAAGAYQERQDKFTRFKTLSDFSAFETAMTAQITELKRDQGVDIANFPVQAAGVFDNARDRYIAEQVPPELQPEFRYRTDLVKQSIIADALKFQYTSQDIYFKQGISQELDRAKLALEQSEDPEKDLELWQNRLAEYVLTTDLAEQEKAQQAREANIALQGMVYKRTLVNSQLSNSVAGSTASVASAIIKREEGFRTKAYSDKRTSTGEHDAWRVGYGTDTVTRADGSVERVTSSTEITKEDAERDLSRRLGEFEGVASNQVGVDRWSALPANVRGALVSVAYNYGSLPNSVVSAVQTGDVAQIANAVEGLSANKGRRKKEAEIIRGGVLPQAEIDNDPRFADLPYEDRLALRKDAASEAASINNAENARQKAQYDTQFNTLLNALHDGAAGMADIQRAYNNGAGWLTDYDDRKKAEKVIADRDKGIAVLTGAQQKLNNDAAIWDPNSKDDKDMQNALFNQRGPEAFSNRDVGYAQGLAAMAARTHDIPTDAIGMLMGMSRSNDGARALYAYNALAMLQEQAPEAFAQRTTEDLASRVDYWRARQQTMPEDELLQALRGGMTTAERQQRTMLRKEAETLLTQKVEKVPRAEKLVGEFIEKFDPYFGEAPQLAGVPWAAKGLDRDFRTAFVDAYEKYGDIDEAKEAAFKSLGRVWGVTEIGGQKTLMKYPPQRVGYKPYGGGYNWIENQVREAMPDLPPGFKFQLLSDDQTDQEFDRWKRDPNAPPPSYMIAVEGDTGWSLSLREQEDEVRGRRTVPLRMNFAPSEKDLLFEEIDFKRRDLEERMSRAQEKLQGEIFSRMGTGGEGLSGALFPSTDLVDQYKQEYNALENELKELDKSDPRIGEEYKNPRFEMEISP